MPITKIAQWQMRGIYGAAKVNGLDNDSLHDFVLTQTGRQHISDLTYKQAGDVIERLNQNASPQKPKQETKKRKGSEFGARDGMASDGQIKKMYALMYGLSEFESKYAKADIGSRLMGIVKKHSNVDALQFLTYEDGNKIIEIMKKMIDTASSRKVENL